MPTLWLVSPSYDDVPSYRRLHAQLCDVVQASPRLQEFEARFVLIDDTAGSDAAIDDIRGLPGMTIIEPPFNLGHQRAIVFGLRRLQHCVRDDDVVVTLDSDGQDRPEDLVPMVDAVLDARNERTVALARRTTRKESLLFKAAYLCFRVVFRALTGDAVRSGNFAAYRGSVARGLLFHPYFDLCYSSTFIALGVPLAYVPCPRVARYEGKSRMRPTSLVMHGMRMLMPFLDRIAIRALSLFSIAFAAGVALCAAIVAVKVFTDNAIPGWATYTAMGAALFSLVALSSSLILFATFSQSRGVSLSQIEREPDGAAGEPPQ